MEWIFGKSFYKKILISNFYQLDKNAIHFANMQEKNSINANFILVKLKKALKITSDKQLSEFLNIKPNTISTWKKRNSVDYKIIISICELYEIDLNEIFYDSGNHFDKNKNYLTDTPLICREIQFQYCVDSSSILDSLPKYNFPFIRSESSRVFQVLSNNMFPIIDENSFVICEEIEREQIQENSLVVIVSKSKGLFINRIHTSHKSKDVYLLTSENTFFETIRLEKEAINEIWLIKGILSYNVTNDNKSKIINDSLIVLDKALAKFKTDI